MASDEKGNTALVGETVVLSFLSDPIIGHGQFRWTNEGQALLRGSIEGAWLAINGERQPMHDLSIFDPASDQAIDAAQLELAGGETMTFWVEFPGVAYTPNFGDSLQVGVTMKIGDQEFEAVSPIQWVRRIPSRDG